jgi:hypothetical protein
MRFVATLLGKYKHCHASSAFIIGGKKLTWIHSFSEFSSPERYSHVLLFSEIKSLAVDTVQYLQVRMFLGLIKCRAMKTYLKEGRGIAPLLLTSALDGSEWSASCTGRFTPGEKNPQYTFYGKLGGL